MAYQNRFSLKSGTILNSEGKGDSLIFPYYDVRRVDGKHQVTQIQIENIGEYGIAANSGSMDGSEEEKYFRKIYGSHRVVSGRVRLRSTRMRQMLC